MAQKMITPSCFQSNGFVSSSSRLLVASHLLLISFHIFDFFTYQCYVVSILEHGGKDLENFVLSDFNEAHSLLTQVSVFL